MNGYVVRTELYKIFSKKYLYAVAAFFVVFIFLLTAQFVDSVEVRYPLAQFRDIAAKAGKDDEFIRKAAALDKKLQDSGKGFDFVSEDMKAILPKSIVSYTEQFRGKIAEGGTSVADILNRDAIDEIQWYRERLDDRRAQTEKLKSELDSMQNRGTTGSFAYKTAEREYRLYTTAPEIRPNVTNWEEFVDLNHAYLPLCIAFLVILGLCGIYSDEYANKTQSELLTSRNGRAGVFGDKLIAGFLYTAVVVTFFQLAGFGIYAAVYGLPGEDISLASLPWFYMSPYHLSARTYYFFQIFGSFLGAFALAAIVMCLSSLAKNALPPFFVSGVVFVSGLFLRKASTFGSGGNTLFTLPAQLSIFMTMSLKEIAARFRAVDLFGIPVSTVWVNLCVTTLVIMAALLLCFRFYTKKQVKN
mgnify:CR=1 FL=1